MTGLVGTRLLYRDDEPDSIRTLCSSCGSNGAGGSRLDETWRSGGPRSSGGSWGRAAGRTAKVMTNLLGLEVRPWVIAVLFLGGHSLDLPELSFLVLVVGAGWTPPPSHSPVTSHVS